MFAAHTSAGSSSSSAYSISISISPRPEREPVLGIRTVGSQGAHPWERSSEELLPVGPAGKADERDRPARQVWQDHGGDLGVVVDE